MSSLCPVVALGSWWGQAGHKLVMHMVVFAGEPAVGGHSVEEVAQINPM